LQIYW